MLINPLKIRSDPWLLIFRPPTLQSQSLCNQNTHLALRQFPPPSGELILNNDLAPTFSNFSLSASARRPRQVREKRQERWVVEATNVVMTSKKTRLYPPATAPTTSFLTPVFSPFPAPPPPRLHNPPRQSSHRSLARLPEPPEARRQPTTLQGRRGKSLRFFPLLTSAIEEVEERKSFQRQELSFWIQRIQNLNLRRVIFVHGLRG